MGIFGTFQAYLPGQLNREIRPLPAQMASIVLEQDIMSRGSPSCEPGTLMCDAGSPSRCAESLAARKTGAQLSESVIVPQQDSAILHHTGHDTPREINSIGSGGGWSIELVTQPAQ